MKSRAGPIGWLLAGGESTMKKSPEINKPKRDASKYDLVIVGTPIWAFTMASPVRTFLTKYGKAIKRAAFFATMDGSGDKRAFEAMASLTGKQPVATLTVYKKEIEGKPLVLKVKAFVSQLGKSF